MTVAYNVNGSVQVCPGCLSEHFEECRGCGEFYEICMLEDGLCPDCAATTPTSEGEVEDGGNNEGYLVYCFDFRGGSDSSRSEGSNLEMSVFTEQSDLEAVIAMMKARADVDSRNIFLLGASQGGMVSAMTAADNKDDIAGAVLLYPAFVLVDNGSAALTRCQSLTAICL